MKRILIITATFLNRPSANGVCVEEIANEFKSRGYDVHILCFARNHENKFEQIEGYSVHRIKPSIINRLRFRYEDANNGIAYMVNKKSMVFLNRVLLLVFAFFFPLKTPIYYKFFEKKACNMIKENNFDIVLSSYNPFEAVAALVKIKENNGVKTVMYTLDSLTNLEDRYGALREFLAKKAWKWEKKIYDNSDIIINMNCHYNHYCQDRYRKYQHKMFIADIPHIKRYDYIEQNNPENITFLYAGTLRREIANIAAENLRTLIESGDIIFEVYGKGNDDCFLDWEKDEVLNKIVNKGMVSHDLMITKEQEAAVLVSMGNTGMDYVPSKIFEYMSLGKKIIHFYNDIRDSALPYLNKYPRSCCIDVRDEIKINFERIRKFIDNNDVQIDYEELERLFLANTPEYTVSLIEKNLCL